MKLIFILGNQGNDILILIIDIITRHKIDNMRKAEKKTRTIGSNEQENVMNQLRRK